MAGHYKEQPLRIALDENFDDFIETLAQYHSQNDGTWISDELVACWQALHRRGNAHCITVLINDELAGGLFFTSFGRMIYGESAMTLVSDAGKLALVALCALGAQHHLPLIDCQMPSNLVNPLGAFSLDGDNFLQLNRELTGLDAPDWSRLPRDLIPLLTLHYTGTLTPRLPSQPLTQEDTVEMETVELSLGSMPMPIFSSECSYYPEKTSRIHVVPVNDWHDFKDWGFYQFFMDNGFRRETHLLTRFCCQGCHECKPTRLYLPDFKPDKSMRRTLKRNRDLVATVRPLSAITDEQLALYYRYQAKRHAGSPMADMSRKMLDDILFSSNVPTYLLELRTSPESDTPNRLMMVCIMDVIDEVLSAVYNFYDPDEPHRSLGTYGILSEIAYARANNLTYLHLGHWLPGYPGMDYKKRFTPLSVFTDGHWVDIDTVDAPQKNQN